MASLVGLSTLLAALAGGCDDTETDGEVAEVEELDGKADGRNRPLGTYDDLDSSRSLVLMADMRFFYWDACGQTDAMLGCEELEVEGTYRLTRSGTRRFLRLTDLEGATFERLRYRVVDGDLELRPATKDTASLLPDRWTVFSRSGTGFCRDAMWCANQDVATDSAWECVNQQCVATEPTVVVACLNGSRAFSVERTGDETFTGQFTNLPTSTPSLTSYECVLWDQGTIRYRCYGDDTSPPFEQINLLRFASGSPGVEFNLVSERNKVGGGDVLFSFLCEDGSSLDF